MSTKESLIIGNRIPKDFFITKGVGESDITTHAGSFHLALKDAGIERANIIQYSSILPRIANEIDNYEITHGEVMETILAVSNGMLGERLTAGIIFGWLFDKKTGEKVGGLVSEENGNYPEDVIEERLNQSLHEIYENGFADKYYLKIEKTIIETFVPEKQYGSAIVAICFVNYIYPILN